MKGDMVACGRCGKIWTIIAHDGFTEQAGYTYRLEDESDRSFICPCKRRRSFVRGSTEPLRTMPGKGRRAWRRFKVLDGEMELFDIGDREITIGGKDIIEAIVENFDGALNESSDNSALHKFSGKYRITIERIEL